MNSVNFSLRDVNHLNIDLNPICHLLALLGAHHIFHVGRIRINISYSLIGEMNFYTHKSKHVNLLCYFHVQFPKWNVGASKPKVTNIQVFLLDDEVTEVPGLEI
jgi:hypothetical protein